MNNKRIKKVFLLITTLTLTIATSFAQSNFTDLSKSKQGIIHDPDGYVNVRKEMNAKSPILGIIVDNEIFNYWEVPNNNWWVIQTQNGLRGYVYSNRIREKKDVISTPVRTPGRITNSNNSNPIIANSNISNSKALIYGNRISVVKIQTGFYGSYNACPSVVIQFKNISNMDIDTDIGISAIFIDNEQGEQLGSKWKYLTFSDLFIQGTTKQIRLDSPKGWRGNISEKNVTARIYVEILGVSGSKKLIETVKIANRLYDGVIE